jgi:hypothetical protein
MSGGAYQRSAAGGRASPATYRRPFVASPSPTPDRQRRRAGAPPSHVKHKHRRRCRRGSDICYNLNVRPGRAGICSRLGCGGRIRPASRGAAATRVLQARCRNERVGGQRRERARAGGARTPAAGAAGRGGIRRCADSDSEARGRAVGRQAAPLAERLAQQPPEEDTHLNLSESGAVGSAAAAARVYRARHCLLLLTVNRARKDGITPMYNAARRGHTAAIVALGRLGADVNRA